MFASKLPRIGRVCRCRYPAKARMTHLTFRSRSIELAHCSQRRVKNSEGSSAFFRLLSRVEKLPTLGLALSYVQTISEAL